jgi:hypothetical protein
MKKTKLILLLIITISFNLKAQNLFPKKLNNCISNKFCLDCGDIKANIEVAKFEKLIEKLNSEIKLKGISGKIMFQILVDSIGNGCVLSHNDNSENIITKQIINNLNEFKGWIPAKTGDKFESRTSFNMSFSILDGKMAGKVERVDIKAFSSSFDKPVKPEIYNKNYEYKNENLKNYLITIWNSKNSNLPNNQTDHITIDKDDVVWLTVSEGLVKFDGAKFINSEQNITEKGKYFGYFALATSNDNTKWVYGTKGIYSYDNTKWIKYENNITGIDGARNIINNEITSEVFFCSSDGLSIFKNGEWKLINKQSLPELPQNNIFCAKRDKQNRLWLGTFKGIIMIDEKNNITDFEKSNTVLRGRNFTSISEDNDGNLYFGLYKNDKGKEMNSDEGIAILDKDGKWKKHTTSNSGIPNNHTEKVFYDKFENVIWIATNSAGVVRFDPKNNTWEVYNSDNSKIPTSWISDISQDSKGNIYLATRQGLVKMERK